MVIEQSLINELGNNFPNPSNPETWIPFAITKAAYVKIQIMTDVGTPL